MRSGSNRARAYLVAWLCAVCLGSATSIATWSLQIDAPIQSVSNFFYMLALPGWVPLYALGLDSIRTNPITILAANIIAWSCWLVLIIACARVAARFHTPKRDESRPSFDASRRAFMTKGVLGAGAISAVASPGYATLVEPWSIKVRRYTIPIDGLPPELEALRIVQFSDSHLGPRIPESFIRHAVSVAADLQPDVLALTGDYIHDGDTHIERAAELCKPMIDAARYGAVGVLGNHDWWGDAQKMAQNLSKLGVHMIDNNRVWLDPAKGELTRKQESGSLALVGLGDLTEDRIDTQSAFSQINPQCPRILLAHQPDTAELESLASSGSPRVDLMLSGHTHGGQVRIPFIGTPLVPSNYGSKYAGGLVQAPRFPVVVSRGIGMSLLPVRFGVPPEIVEITLTRA